MVDRQDTRAANEQDGVLDVFAKPQSYRNIVYLLLGLPLGTLYFTVLVTGWSVGLSMLIVALSGIPILIGLWYVTRGFMSFERGLAVALLGADISRLPPVPSWTGGMWQQFKALMRDKPTWLGVSYLLLRFPAGIATFTVAVTLVATSLGLAFAPTYMWTSDDLTWAGTTFDPFPWSFALIPIGLVLAFVSLHLMNALASACGRWAQASLGARPPEASRDSYEIDLTASAQPTRPRVGLETDEREPIEVEA